MSLKSILFLLIFLPGLAVAQHSNFHPFWEVGPYFGLANYSGDVAGRRFQVNETRLGFGLLLRHHFHEKFDVRAHFMSGRISGSDSHARPDQTYLLARKLEFFTMIREFGLIGEWKIRGQSHMAENGVHNFHLTPFLFAGGAVTLIDPTTKCYGTPEECAKLAAPLPEPGLKKTFFALPVGAGIRFDFQERLSLSPEIGWRVTFSDYIDGVAANGNVGQKDWYILFGVNANYIFGNYDGRRR